MIKLVSLYGCIVQFSPISELTCGTGVCNDIMLGTYGCFFTMYMYVTILLLYLTRTHTNIHAHMYMNTHTHKHTYMQLI